MFPCYSHRIHCRRHDTSLLACSLAATGTVADTVLQQTRAAAARAPCPGRRVTRPQHGRVRHRSPRLGNPNPTILASPRFSPGRPRPWPRLTCGAAGRAQLLSEREREWVDSYHAQVWAAVSPRLAGAPLEWLRVHTLPLPTAGHAAEPTAVAAPPPAAPAAAMVVA